MFKCQYCGYLQKPNKKQFKVTIKERTRSNGSKEIIEELSVCENCKNELEALPFSERE